MFYEVTRAAEGALGRAPPCLHCRRSHRRRKETPAAYEVNPRSQPRRHTVTPAVTRSAARAQLGVGDQPGAFTVLSAKESTSAAITTSAVPYSDSPELPTCPTCDLETPATHAQAHAGPHSKIWGAARAPASADGIAASAEAAEPATSGNVPSAASVGGAVKARESSAGAVPSDAATEAAPSTDGLLPLLRQRRGRPERSRQQLGPMAKSAARGGRPPTPSIPVPCVRWRSTSTTATGCSMAVAATITPMTTTHGGM